MSEWVSVDSGVLPPKQDAELSVDVLVLAANVVHQAALQYETEEWIDSDGDEVYWVTHWQPLPPPPEQTE